MLSRSARAGVWSGLIQWSRVGINAAVFVLLSRWLSLADIGAVAAAQAPFIFTQNIQSSIFPDVIVQDESEDDRRLSALFWISVLSGVVITLAVLLFVLVTPETMVAPRVKQYLAIFSTLPIIWGVGAIYEGLLRRTLKMKRLALRTTAASSAAAAVAIYLGATGGGGWAIVAFAMVNAVVQVGFSIAAVHWLPTAGFQRSDFNYLMPKVGAFMGRYALSAAVVPALQVCVSSQLGAAAGGIFQITFRIYTLLDTVLVSPFRFLILPTFSRARREGEDVGEKMVAAISVGAIAIIPAFAGLASIAPILLPFMLGERNGPPAIGTVQILMSFGALSLVTWITNNALTATGRVAVVFKRSLVVFVISTIPCLVASTTSLKATFMVYSYWGGVIGLLMAIWLSKTYFNLSARKLLAPLAVPTLGATGMVLVTLALAQATPHLHPISRLILMIGGGAVTYGTVCLAFGRKQLMAVVTLFRKKKSGGSPVPKTA